MELINGKIYQEIPRETIEEKLKYIEERLAECEAKCQAECAELNAEKANLLKVIDDVQKTSVIKEEVIN